MKRFKLDEFLEPALLKWAGNLSAHEMEILAGRLERRAFEIVRLQSPAPHPPLFLPPPRPRVHLN